MSGHGHGRQEASSLLPLHSLNRESEDGDSDLEDLLAEDGYANGVDAFDVLGSRRSRSSWTGLTSRLPFFGSFVKPYQPSKPATTSARRRPWKRRVSLWLLYLLCFWIAFSTVFLPSYSRPPQHYNDLKSKARASTAPSRGNIRNEKVFIATSIYDKDGTLLSGDWGRNLLDLVDVLGPKNVFLSVYENDAGEEAAKALSAFEGKLTCKHMVLNEHLNTTDLRHVVMPDGERLLKRIAFLATVRNRALAPLDTAASSLADFKPDKLLYVNDVMFNPIDAANLLFSTRVNEQGKADYRAACATDFINPFKFYDTFATRDLAGNDMGVPFYPWFANSGKGTRRDVLEQKDAVRVRSCWGGMVAFDAKYFLKSAQPPLRFRAEDDPFWDASECCLIHADLQNAAPAMTESDTGIYMNPYIRVAYDSRTLSWLGFTRRFERVYAPVQHVINILASRPSYNPRQYEKPGDKVKDRVWLSDDTSGSGAYKDIERIAKPGGFCGGRKLLALPEDGHGGHWYSQPPPPDVI